MSVKFNPTLEIPTSALTLEGFRAWAKSDDFPQTGWFAWLDGVLHVDLNPEWINRHNAPKTEITKTLSTICVEGPDLGRVFSDRMLITNVASGLSTEPDVTFATWDTLRSQRLRFVPQKSDPDDAMELEGTPDLVVEIVSPTSRRKDTKTLRRLYHRAGVPEYWLVDALEDELDFRILVRGEKDYEDSPSDTDGFRSSPVFGRAFRLTRDRDPIGDWRYRLEHREA